VGVRHVFGAMVFLRKLLGVPEEELFLLLMLRPAKYDVALVRTKLCKYEHVSDAPSGLCMTWQ
jgi:hypothetical protein